MEELTAYFLKLLEVLEKEFAFLKQSLGKAAGGLGMVTVGFLLVAIGLLLLAWTCFTALSQWIGRVPAGLITSLLILGGGALLLQRGGKAFNDK